MKTIKIG